MSPQPESFLRHLQAQGYHPRSNKHSNALAEAIVADLVANCPVIAAGAAAGALVCDLNFTINAGTSDWNVDLVLGPPPPGTPPPESGCAIRRTPPSTVQVAIEIKSVMTEHRKAVKNRKRDFEAHHEHVHRYSNRAIAAGVLIVNRAEEFSSPLRDETTVHKDPAALVKHCIQQTRGITSRTGLQGEGLEAMAVIVVDMDNVRLSDTAYVVGPPAPNVGDQLHYDAFIQSLCSLFGQRFAP